MIETTPEASVLQSQLLQSAGRLLPGGRLGHYLMPDSVTCVMARGSGSKVYDLAGKEYIDYILGGGPMVLGHGHPAVVSAIKEQAERGTQFYWLTEPLVDLAQELVTAVPCAEMVKFTASGSEATFYAMRLARAFTGRDGILRFET